MGLIILYLLALAAAAQPLLMLFTLIYDAKTPKPDDRINNKIICSTDRYFI
jgi:hypothetical protein